MEPTLSHVPDRSCHVPPVPLSAVRRRPGRGLASAPWRSLWWIHRSQVPPQSRSDLHLIFAADGQPLLVVASCAHRVDTRRVAALIGAGKVRLADPEPVISATGQTIGGVRAPGPHLRYAPWSTPGWAGTRWGGSAGPGDEQTMFLSFAGRTGKPHGRNGRRRRGVSRRGVSCRKGSQRVLGGQEPNAISP